MKNISKKQKIMKTIMNLVEAIDDFYNNETNEAKNGNIHNEFSALYKKTIDKMRSGELPGDSYDELQECGYTEKLKKLIVKNGGWCDFPVDIFKGAIFDGPDSGRNGITFVKFPDGTVFADCAEVLQEEKCVINNKNSEKISPAELVEKIKAEGRSGNVFIAITSCFAEDIENVIMDSEDDGEFEVFGGCWQAELKFADNVIQIKELNDTFIKNGPNIFNPVVLGIEFADYIPSIGDAGENNCDYGGEDTYELDEGEKITPENGLNEILDILRKLLDTI